MLNLSKSIIFVTVLLLIFSVVLVPQSIEGWRIMRRISREQQLNAYMAALHQATELVPFVMLHMTNGTITLIMFTLLKKLEAL